MSFASPLRDAPHRSPLRRFAGSAGWNLAIVVELAVLLVLWEIAVHGLDLWNPKFIPAPSDIGAALGLLISNGRLAIDLQYSSVNFLIGYAVAAASGVVMGFLLAVLPKLRAAFFPFFWIGYVTPKIAFQPLLVIWFGFGVFPKVVIIVLMAFFPIVVIVYEGVRGIDRSLIRAGQVFGTRGLDLYRKIILPATLPFVLTALRIGIARALVGVVIGEFIGGNAGLGFSIQTASQNFVMAQSLALAFVLIVVANLSMFLLDVVKRRLAPWAEVRAQA